MARSWQQHGCLGILPLIWALSAGLASAADHGVILVYHHVATTTPASTSISPQLFRQHMTYLKDNNYNVLALNRLVDALRDGAQLPEKSIAISFDDGYASVYTDAFPLLDSMAFPFTVFVSTDSIDKQHSAYVNWAQLREMADAGVLIGNHTVSHPYLLERPQGEPEQAWMQSLEHEILAAEAAIEKQTGQTNRFLAYPYGEYDSSIKSLVDELGFTGFAQNSGAVGWHSDFLAVPRFPLAGAYTGLDSVSLKFSTRAFHISEQVPDSPVTSNPSPNLQLRFEPGNYDLNQLNCFANNQPTNHVWLDRDAGLLKLNPDAEFSSRRWLYTCTAPARDSNDYYWFSKLWVNPAKIQPGY